MSATTHEYVAPLGVQGWTENQPHLITDWTIDNWIDEARRQYARARAAEAERDHLRRVLAEAGIEQRPDQGSTE